MNTHWAPSPCPRGLPRPALRRRISLGDGLCAACYDTHARRLAARVQLLAAARHTCRALTRMSSAPHRYRTAATSPTGSRRCGPSSRRPPAAAAPK
eukprot:6715843-Prymnesium_polylepis.2